MQLLLAAYVSVGLAQTDWRDAEAPILTDHVQLTFPQMFSKAGEAYFDPTGQLVIFQATPTAEYGRPGPHYEMYVCTLNGYDSNNGAPGLTTIVQVSQTGSANTCGWFHPTQFGRVLFGSTILPPVAPDKAGYQRDSGRYRWQFPAETEIVSGLVQFDRLSPRDDGKAILVRPIIKPLWKEPGYSAEGSWSPDGRFILYTWVNPETNDPDLYLREPATGYVTPIVVADGYDGGPFFSPDGSWITYRSDRRGDNLLQIFIAELSFDDQGRPNGIKREIQLTDNEFVNWGPFWHPSGAFLVYSTNQAAPETHNYEVFAIDARLTTDPPTRMRLTYAEGFDGLPVFNSDGSIMMWTSQRAGPTRPGERPTSQIWMAKFNFDAFIEKFSNPDGSSQ
ncbi:MAG: hypothetical protein D6695_02310 [Planctomycetota bacterium]|nr:MAG: hypothetical protein D6695_02310 [Planctomycetota bacterium]